MPKSYCFNRTSWGTVGYERSYSGTKNRSALTGMAVVVRDSIRPASTALVPANKKKDPRYAEICRDIVGYSGMRPRRLRPMIVGVPLEPGVGGMGGEYDIDAEGGDGGGPDPIGDGVVADGAGAVDAASPAGVCGVKAFGDLLGEGPGIGPAGGVVADLGGDLARHRPQRRHLDPARRSARRGRFITPRL